MARLENFFRVNVFPGSEIDDSGGVFEFDESDVVWSGGDSANKYWTSSKAASNRRSPSTTRFRSAGPTVSTSASLPVNIPDWSKIYKEDCYGERRRRAEMRLGELAEDSDYEDEWSGGGGDWEEERVPPHEYLARRRGASLSVNEAAGRTLKVRNAIWKKVGFED